jgi:hypothetical protein
MLVFTNKTYAMGIFQSDIGYIPMPPTNISFTIIDNLGVRTTVEHGSIDGKDYISGYNGLILNVIPLKNITFVSFTETSNAKTSLPADLIDKLDNKPLMAIVHLKDNKVLNIIVDGSLICYGKTPYGYVRIKLTLIDSIEDIRLLKKEKIH